MTKAVSKVKEWQNLIAGLSLALSIAYAATKVGNALIAFSFNAGQAVQQHTHIIEQQTRIIAILDQKCK